MRSQTHSPTAQWGRKAPQQSLLFTPIPCSEWSQLDQGDQELFCISWGNLRQCSIIPIWKDVSVELPVFQPVTIVSCSATLGINGNNLAMGLPCLRFLKANVTSKGWGEGGFRVLQPFLRHCSAAGPHPPCLCCWYVHRNPSCSFCILC